MIKPILSIDDFNLGNIDLAKTIQSYGLQENTIFFIELMGKRVDTTGKTKEELIDPANKVQIEKLNEMGFEVFSHNIWHDNSLKERIHKEQFNQIFRSKEILEDLTGKECTWYCPNRGRYNEQILNIIKDAGYKYIRTTKVFDIEPIKEGINHTSLHCFERSEYEGVDWLEVGKGLIDKVNKEGGCFKMWAHCKELSRPGEMDKFKEILKHVKDNE